MLDTTITRGDNGQEAVLKLPGLFDGNKETLSVLEAICLRDIATAITSADTSIESLDRILPGTEIDEQELNKLGFLSRRTGGLCDSERNILTDILELEPFKSLQDIVNLSCNLHKFERLLGVKDTDAMGRYLLKERGIDVPGNIADYIACDQAANRYLTNHPGVFTNSGFVFRKDESLEIVYDGEKLPGPCCNPNGIITIWLSHKDKPNHAILTFLTTEECTGAVLAEFGVKDLEDYYAPCTSPISGLLERLPNYDGPKCPNPGTAYMGVLEEQYQLFMAVVEAGIPGSMSGSPEIAGALHQYRLLPEDIKAPEDYARYLMNEGGICCVDGIIAEFANFDALSKAMMKENDVVSTSLGIVEWYDHPIRQLPEELTILRLFSLLYTQVFTRDGYGDLNWEPKKMSAHKVRGYREEILRAIANRRIDSEGSHSLTVHLKNELLARKVYSINPTVEARGGKLWGVLEVQTHGELSKGKLRELTEVWSGQYSDGWREGLEQQEIKIDQEELHVNFWHSGGDFVVLTEVGPKSQAEQQNSMVMQ